ncbi:MAG: hypothetical protein K2X74_21070, partial [Acetobacteraceae bacterium]|nr:hypothetical protein [Acetobacteraceae bacterium]
MQDPARPRPVSTSLLLLATPLALTQMIGWGTTFWLPAVLVGPLIRDLAISSEAVFGGITIMLLVSAAVGPRFGRIIDGGGTRWAMAAGSACFALAMVMLSVSQGLAGYVLAWILIGIGTPLALTQAAAAAMAQLAGPNARQAIGVLMLLGGFASTVFWPLTAFLDATIGWRAMCLVFAALHLAVCAPIHAIFLAPRTLEEPVPSHLSRRHSAPPLDAVRRRSAFILMAIAFSLQGFVTWGLP